MDIPQFNTLPISLVPTDMMEESRRKAEKNPYILKKNWEFAGIIIIIWLCIIMIM